MWHGRQKDFTRKIGGLCKFELNTGPRQSVRILSFLAKKGYFLLSSDETEEIKIREI